MRHAMTGLILAGAFLAVAGTFAGGRHLHSSDSDYSLSEDGHAIGFRSHDASGVVVYRAAPTPFHGMQVGDVIVAVDGRTVAQVDTLLAMARRHDGSPMTLRVRRAGAEVVVVWSRADVSAMFPPPPLPPEPPTPPTGSTAPTPPTPPSPPA